MEKTVRLHEYVFPQRFLLFNLTRRPVYYSICITGLIIGCTVVHNFARVCIRLDNCRDKTITSAQLKELPRNERIDRSVWHGLRSRVTERSGGGCCFTLLHSPPVSVPSFRG